MLPGCAYSGERYYGNEGILKLERQVDSLEFVIEEMKSSPPVSFPVYIKKYIDSLKAENKKLRYITMFGQYEVLNNYIDSLRKK